MNIRSCTYFNEDPYGGEVEEEKLLQELVPLTTNREISSWYSYEWASSVWTTCGMGTFLPIFVSNLATYVSNENCEVPFFSTFVAPATMVSSLISISVLIQLVIFIMFGALADFGNLRKNLLIITGFVGALFTLSHSFIGDPNQWWILGILMVITNVIYGYTTILYNAYMPLLSKSTPQYINSDSSKKKFELSKLSDHFSNNGYFWGYISGVICLIFSLFCVLFVKQPLPTLKVLKCPEVISLYNFTINGNFTNQDPPSDSTLAYRAIMAIIGVWWLVFNFGIFFIKQRPGPDLPPGKNYISQSWLTLINTFKKVRKLPEIFKLLIIYFIASDTWTTAGYFHHNFKLQTNVSIKIDFSRSVGILFLSDELHVAPLTLSIMLLEIPIFGGISLAILGKLRSKFSIKSKVVIHFTMLLFILILVYMLFGFIPGATAGMVGHDWEVYMLGFILGVSWGPLQSSYRSIFSMLIPAGHESEFFSFFAISDKGSSWMGPLICAAIRQATGTMRWAILYLAFMCLITIPMLKYMVHIKKGQEEAKIFEDADGVIALNVPDSMDSKIHIN